MQSIQRKPNTGNLEHLPKSQACVDTVKRFYEVHFHQQQAAYAGLCCPLLDSSPQCDEAGRGYEVNTMHSSAQHIQRPLLTELGTHGHYRKKNKCETEEISFRDVQMVQRRDTLGESFWYHTLETHRFDLMDFNVLSYHVRWLCFVEMKGFLIQIRK